MAKKRDAVPDKAPKPQQPAPTSVGSRVVTRHSSDSELAADQWPKAAGIIVDDFGDTAGHDNSYGRDWAITRRWAIALDDGPLVFRNDNEIEAED
ncbi:hypothetical protein [Antrihabitans sp. YC2-6]|uniref:hypothetical protein n=1 Tax=Antrihabitans sp. YC2-6 TaxID=2799498 RepID=UPI0035A8C779